MFMLSYINSTIKDVQYYNIQLPLGNELNPDLVVLLKHYSCLFEIPTALAPHSGAFDHTIPLT